MSNGLYTVKLGKSERLMTAHQIVQTIIRARFQDVAIKAYSTSEDQLDLDHALVLIKSGDVVVEMAEVVRVNDTTIVVQDTNWGRWVIPAYALIKDGAMFRENGVWTLDAACLSTHASYCTSIGI